MYYTDAHISLDEEAYERLRAHKREGESFSDVIKRLAGERSWSELAGILTNEEADALEDAAATGRSRSAERADRVADELTEATNDAEALLSVLESESRPRKVSVVTVLELYEGVARTNTPDDKRREVLDVLESKHVVEADATVMRRAGQLSGSLITGGERIKREDCIVAATARATNPS